MHSLTRLLLAVKRQNGEIYLIVDEVDSFMNYMLLDIEGNADMSDSQLNENLGRMQGYSRVGDRGEKQCREANNYHGSSSGSISRRACIVEYSS